MKKIVSSLILTFALFFITASESNAAEGIVQMSTRDGNTRCFISMIEVNEKDAGFRSRVLLSCRNLIYPLDSQSSQYVLWGDEVGIDNHLKFGDIDLGRRFYWTTGEVNRFFLTIEPNGQTTQPAGPVIMEGPVREISFLQTGSVDESLVGPQITPDSTMGSDIYTNQESGGEIVEDEEIADEEASPSASGAGNAFRILGIVVIVVIVIIIAIAFISASRRKPVQL